MKHVRAVELDSVKSARKAKKDKLHEACERVSEIHERTFRNETECTWEA